MTIVVAVVRLVLAGVFIVSAIAKLRDRSGSRAGVEAFGVPAAFVGLVAGALPVVELACAALLLLPDPFATAGAVGSLALLLAFTVAIVVNLAQGKHPECHCFGDLGEGGGIGWMTVVRNAALMVFSAVSLIGAGGLRSVPATLADLSATEGAVLAGLGLLTAALVAMGLALQTLMQRYGSVLLRLEALEQATGVAAPRPAPDFRLADLGGVTVTRDDVLNGNRPAMLVFISPTCRNCTELLPDLTAWQNDPDHPFSVVVISDGSVQENLTKLDDVGPLRVLLQPDFSVSDAYGIQGTPAAVVVGTDARLAGSPAHALDEVRSLHRTLIDMMAEGQSPGPAHQHVHQIESRPIEVGDPVPGDVLVTSEDGLELPLAQALGDEALLLFWRSDCGFCEQILEDVRELEASTPIRIVSGSDPASLRATGLISTVLRDPTGALESWLRVPGTPSAAWVRQGALDSSVGVGGPEVLALLHDRSRPRARSNTDLDHSLQFEAENSVTRTMR